MQVVISKHAGFCVGVKRAVEEAFSKANQGVYILGDVIHNESVLLKLKNAGAITVNSADEVKSGTIIIRSHGVGKEVIKGLENRGINVINMTCPFVMKTQKIVEEHYANGYLIVIVGKENHPEVIGLNGWCNDTAVIVDGSSVPESIKNAEKVCIVAQTTCSHEKFENFLKKIKNFKHKTLAVFHTICYTTMERQSEAKELSSKMQAMVVIGGKDSSNTQKLFEICKSNCPNTYFVSTPSALDYKKLKQYKSIGIVSGASTPYEQAMEVYLTMDEQKEVNLMEQVLTSLDEKQNLKRGQKIKVVVSSINEDGLKVYFDGKTDVTLPKENLSCEEFSKDAYCVGDEIEVVVMGTRPLSLSQKQIEILKREEILVAEIKEGKTFNVSITGSNKGGIVGKFENFDVFVPAKEIKIGFVADLTKYVGKSLRVKALKVEYNARKREIVASQKVILEAEKAQREAEKLAKEEAFFSSISENDVVTGTVARFAKFGAFVVVNGFDCLAHVSDLSWVNVKAPQDVLEIGKAYDFVVLKVDKENKKVSIGYKQLQPKPWDLVPEKYSVGDIITGKVVRLVDFGAFVEIEKGVDGLVHISEITHNFIENPASALKVGDEVNAKILSINLEKEKINLSIKALIEAPQKEEVEEKPKKEKKAKTAVNDEDLRSWTESANDGVSIADLLNK